MTKSKLLFVDWRNDFFINAIDTLIKDNNVDIIHITSDVDFSKFKNNEKMTFIDQMQFDRPENIFEINNENNLSISKELVERYLKSESIFLSLIDRFTYFSISVQKRKRIYYELLLYWENFFKENNIDLVCFPTAPHMGYDYVLYEVAKQNKIKTFVLERTLFNDRLIIKDDIYDEFQVADDFLDDLSVDQLESKLDEFLLSQTKEVKNYWIDYSNNIINNVTKKSKTSKTFSFFNRILLIVKNISILFKPLRISALRYDRSLPKILIHFISLYENIKVRRLRNLYENNISIVDYKNIDYIYLPLHFQPERSTEPLGDIFSQQELIVNIISNSISEDWKIVVKEHPRQFDHSRINSIHHRDESFYKNLLKDDKVLFTSLDTDSEYLADNSKMIATITGSSGWQAIVKGKEVLLFGYPWYSACKNCYIISSDIDCKIAIDNSINKSIDERKKDLLKYLIYMKDKFIISTNDDRFAKISEIKYDKLIENLVECIILSAKK